MAEAMEVNNLHIENLSKLCRVCGCRLTKQKIHQTSYSCEEHKEFLAKNFQIQIEKDDKSIHPVRFCHLCFCTNTREHFTWKAHNDDHCPTCETEQRHKKGGRRKKSRRGGGKREGKVGGAAASTQLFDLKADLVKRICELQLATSTYRVPEFDEKFKVVERKKEEFECPICKDILDMPVEAACGHCTCCDCLISTVQNCVQQPSCAVCQSHFTNPENFACPSRSFTTLISRLDVECRVCCDLIEYHLCITHVCDPERIAANSPVPQAPAPPRTIEEAFKELEKGQISKDVAALANKTVRAKMQQSQDRVTARLEGPGRVIILHAHLYINDFFFILRC